MTGDVKDYRIIPLGPATFETFEYLVPLGQLAFESFVEAFESFEAVPL